MHLNPLIARDALPFNLKCRDQVTPSGNYWSEISLVAREALTTSLSLMRTLVYKSTELFSDHLYFFITNFCKFSLAIPDQLTRFLVFFSKSLSQCTKRPVTKSDEPAIYSSSLHVKHARYSRESSCWTYVLEMFGKKLANDIWSYSNFLC